MKALRDGTIAERWRTRPSLAQGQPEFALESLFWSRPELGMQVTINRALCGHHPAACEDCFGQFLATGVPPERGCITAIVDDGLPELVVRIGSGERFGTLVVTPENRDAVIYEGWMKHARLPSTENSPSEPK